MKLSLKLSFLLILAVLSLSQTAWADFHYAANLREDWKINSFHSEIYLRDDGLVEITETIVADFTDEPHRGVERSIPYKYETGRSTQVYFESAIDEKGRNWDTNPYRESGVLYIPMKTHDDSRLNGEATFILKYRVENAINFFETHDEFFWNINGTSWRVPIQNTTATIHLPEKIADTQLKCITGAYGAEEYNCKWHDIDKKTVEFTASGPLQAFEGLSVVIGLPAETIAKPGTEKQFWWFIRNNPGLILPLVTLIVMLALWFKYGRDDATVKDTVIPHYAPPQGLLPSETGTLIDERLDPRDITATIIDYAIKGYIRINEIKKDFELELLKQYKTERDYEKIILAGIFHKNKTGEKRKISDLTQKFYSSVPNIKKSLINQMVRDGYFPHRPTSVRSLYEGIGGAILFGSFYITGLLSFSTFIGLVVSGIIIMALGQFMPRKTKKGTETYYHLKGLYEYIDTAEKDRMKFQEENHILFEKLLPYAMAFGLIKKWTKAFDGLIKNPPGWYSPARPWHEHPFTMIYFSDRLSNFSNKTLNSVASRPGGGGGGAWSAVSGFGGGGFSGGGFGGGGGRGL